jgi:type IV pilus assembly protein PilQ
MTTPALFLLIALALPPQLARTAPENRLTGISVKEGEKFTVIEVANTRVPTFSVFKLEDPPRLFVDLTNTAVEFDRTLEVYNGVVNQVGTLQFKNHQSPTGRIIVNLRQDALYTVDSAGSTLRIVVDGNGRLAAAPDDGAVKALQARETELKDRIRTYEDKEKALAETIRARGAELDAMKARGQDDLSALKDAVTLESERRGKAAEARAKDEELKAATEKALAEEQQRLAVVKAAVKAEEERKQAVEAARLKEEERRKYVAEARAKEESLLDKVRSTRAQQESVLAQITAKNEDLATLNGQLAGATRDEQKRLNGEKAALEKDLAGLKKAREAEARRTSDAEASLKQFQARHAAQSAQMEMELMKVRTAVGQASGKLTELETRLTERNRQKEALEDSVASLKNEKGALTAELEAIKAGLAASRSNAKDAQKEADQRQAAAAREVARMEAELKGLVDQRRTNEARMEEARGGLASLTMKLAELKGRVAQEQERLDKAIQVRQLEEQKIAELQKTVGELSEAAPLKAELDKTRQELEQAARQNAELDRARAELEHSRQAYQARVVELEQARGTDRANESQARRQVEAAQAEMDRQRGQYEARMAEQRQSSETELTAARAEVAQYQATVDRLQAQARAQAQAGQAVTARSTQELETARRQLAAEQERVAGLQARADRLLAEKEAELAKVRGLLEETRKGYEAELASRGSQIGGLRTQLSDLTTRLEQAEAAHREAVATGAGNRSALNADVQRLKAELARTQADYQGQVKELQASLDRSEAQYQQELSARNADVDQLKGQVSSLEGRLQSRGGEMSTLQEQIASLKTRLAEANAAREEATQARDQATNRAAALQGQLDEQKAANQALNSEIGKTRFVLTAQKNLRAQEETNLKALQGRITGLEADIQRVRGEKNAGHQSELAAKEAALASLQRDRDSVTANLEELARSHTADQARLAELEGRLKTNQGELERVRAEMARRDSQGDAARDAETARAQAARQELESALAAKQADLGKLQRETEALARERQTAQQKVEVAEAAARELQTALASKDAELTRMQGEVQEMARARQADQKALDEARTALVASMKKAEEAAAAAPKAEPARAPAAPAVAEVTDLRFADGSESQQLEITLKGEPSYRVVAAGGGKKVLVLADAHLDARLERIMDVSAYKGGIQSVASFNDRDTAGQVRIVADSKPGTRDEVRVIGDRLVWSFAGREADKVKPYFPATVGAEDAGPAPMAAAPVTPSLGQGGADSGPGILNPYPYKKRKQYSGKRINLTIKDADIQDVLSFLAREGGTNIVATDDVQGKVSFHLENIPWDLAFDMILKAKGLDYVKEGDVYRVAPLETIQKEYDILLEKKKKMAALKQLVVRLITVNYADGQELVKRAKNLISEKGSVDLDGRTNTLIVKDIEEHVLAIEDLVRRLDTQTPQVLIEARIVEASSNFTEEVGVQWGGNLGFGSAYGNQTGLVFPNVIGLSGGSDSPNSPTGGLAADSPGFAVNLPAAVGAGSGGSLGLTLGSIGGSANLSLRLSAAEEQGSVKIVSAPKVSTLDNTTASIQQGVSIPISVVSAQGVNTQFFNALLKLDVTPHVTQDGNIAVKINVSKNEPDFGQTGANGNPTIRKKEANTELLIKDGDTTVIGGIYTRATSDKWKKVPFFADLPLFGPLFRNHGTQDQKSELLIFLTPRIINRQASEVKVD